MRGEDSSQVEEGGPDGCWLDPERSEVMGNNGSLGRLEVNATAGLDKSRGRSTAGVSTSSKLNAAQVKQKCGGGGVNTDDRGATVNTGGSCELAP